MGQLKTHRPSLYQKPLLCLLIVFCASCVVSIDTVNHYSDEQTITVKTGPVRHTVMSDDHPIALWENPIKMPRELFFLSTEELGVDCLTLIYRSRGKNSL